jgi:hypothetical protein
LPVYTPVIHPKLKKLFEDMLTISQGPAVDMADKLHRFGTGQVSEQLIGTHLDDDMVGILAENETNICVYPLTRIFGSPQTYTHTQFVNVPLARPLVTISLFYVAPAGFAMLLGRLLASKRGLTTRRRRRPVSTAGGSKSISTRCLAASRNASKTVMKLPQSWETSCVRVF